MNIEDPININITDNIIASNDNKIINNEVAWNTTLTTHIIGTINNDTYNTT